MKNTVLITGASSGFGKVTSKLFHQQGWNVIATMRSPGKEDELKTLENVFVTRLDVQDAASIQSAVGAGLEKFGRIDAVINNAGYGLMGVFESSSREQIRRQFDVNLFGTMDVTRAVLPHLRTQHSGVIVNLSTVGGVVGFPFGSPYISSKWAVEGFSESLSNELLSLGIQVKIVQPGSVATNFRTGIEMIKNEIPEYNPLMASLFANYAKATEHLRKATPEEVAATIYTAVTDGKPQLRYRVGDDTQFYFDLRRRQTEDEFMQQVRAFMIG
jgi:NAD(P)-dependent dehydrogenase (short-subunit alcohol dehydrogenase family)